jgi:histidinol dehydrogenase
VQQQLLTPPTATLAGAAWNNNGEVVVGNNDDEAIALSDEYAPEHLGCGDDLRDRDSQEGANQIQR